MRRPASPASVAVTMLLLLPHLLLLLSLAARTADGNPADMAMVSECAHGLGCSGKTEKRRGPKDAAQWVSVAAGQSTPDSLKAAGAIYNFLWVVSRLGHCQINGERVRLGFSFPSIDLKDEWRVRAFAYPWASFDRERLFRVTAAQSQPRVRGTVVSPKSGSSETPPVCFPTSDEICAQRE